MARAPGAAREGAVGHAGAAAGRIGVAVGHAGAAGRIGVAVGHHGVAATAAGPLCKLHEPIQYPIMTDQAGGCTELLLMSNVFGVRDRNLEVYAFRLPL